jgi:hypothetical protein
MHFMHSKLLIMKDKKSESKSSSTQSKNPKKDHIVNEQEQQHAINPQQELHEQDRPSGDYVSEREMSRKSQDKPDTESGDKKKINSGTNAEKQKEKFEE